MAAEDPNQGNSEVSQLFENVGQGLVLVNQYLQGIDPELAGMADQIMQGFIQLTEATKQARGGGGPQQQQQQQSQPVPQEAGSANVQQAF